MKPTPPPPPPKPVTIAEQLFLKQFSPRFTKYILKTANKKGVDPLLVFAVMRHESSFDIMAESQAGAKGLMQVMPFHFKGLSVSQMFDPYNNVLHGIGLLSTALKKHKGNIRIALAEYNAGGEAVKKYRGVPPYSETRKYVANITSHYKKLKGS